MKRGRLVLGNGLVMEGVSVGVEGTTVGELVFNTSMSGYQEMMTDPSYCGQVVMLTTPHVGNVGVNADDAESAKCWCSGLIVRSFSKRAANWRSEQSLESYLQEQNIVALADIDTRHLTHLLRAEGAQSVCITTELDNEAAQKKAQEFILNVCNNSIRLLVNYMEKFKLLNLSIDEKKVKEICTNISFYEFENYTKAWYVEKNLQKSIKLIYSIYNKGYSVMDILDSYFSFIKVTNIIKEDVKYKIIIFILKYIAVFHTLHENDIELVIFTNELLKI